MDASYTPGMNSIEPAGLKSPEVLRVASILDKRGSVNVIEISDLCPFFDFSGNLRVWRFA